MEMVGLGRVELPTSRLSGVRSNHLSYRPADFAPKGRLGGLEMRTSKEIRTVTPCALGVVFESSDRRSAVWPASQ